MFKSFSRFSSVVALSIGLAACQGAGTAEKLLNPGYTPAKDSVTQAEVVQGACPSITLREGTTYFTTYAKGGENDPEQVIHQASISKTTRQCRISGSQMTMTVQASGRVVAGPEGGPGTVTLPIRVAVVQGQEPIYSDLQKLTVELPSGDPSAQFFFENATVTFPADAAGAVKVWLGFDPGPYDTP